MFKVGDRVFGVWDFSDSKDYQLGEIKKIQHDMIDSWYLVGTKWVNKVYPVRRITWRGKEVK